ncbi:hypothetical protein NFI96_027474 [Prochilodus magdalenae]|nr:hypothetical protein NFI96_027474 [Prochilodus magdalenae]
MMFLCSLSLFIIMIESCVSQSISPLEEKVDAVEDPLIHVGGVSTCWNSRTQISPHYLNTGTTMMFLCSLSLFIIMIDGSSAHSISPLENRTQVHTVEGQTVTLSCRYDGIGVPTLFWYHQYPGSRPEHLLTIIPGSDAVSLGRLKAEVDKDLNRVDLEISAAAVSDSVLYYCALQPTVTGNPDTLYRNWFYDSCRAVLLSGGGAVYLCTFRPSSSSTSRF